MSYKIEFIQIFSVRIHGFFNKRMKLMEWRTYTIDIEYNKQPYDERAIPGSPDYELKKLMRFKAKELIHSYLKNRIRGTYEVIVSECSESDKWVEKLMWKGCVSEIPMHFFNFMRYAWMIRNSGQIFEEDYNIKWNDGDIINKREDCRRMNAIIRGE